MFLVSDTSGVPSTQDIRASHGVSPPQVGEFYEAMGTDAVVLVQWAGLNPMGSTHMPPRAGCPHMNIRRTLQSLVEEANLSVVCLLTVKLWLIRALLRESWPLMDSLLKAIGLPERAADAEWDCMPVSESERTD